MLTLTVERYGPIRRWFMARTGRLTALRILYTFLPLPLYFFYPVLLFILARTHDPRFLRVMLVPAAALVLCTLLRRALHQPRPYDQPGFSPLIKKGSPGEALPSRHAVSAFIIAFTCWTINARLGVFLGVVACGVCVVRVLAGVHHPKDILAGVLFAAAAAVIGFVLIP